MSSAAKKPSPSKSLNPKPAVMSTPSRSPMARGASSTTVTANGLARVQSTRGTAGTSNRSGREAVKRPSPNANMNFNVSDDPSEEDARAENITIMDELKSRMRKAETASEDYQRQLNLLQTRLDDSLSHQAKLEDQMAEDSGKMEELESARLQESRQKRDLEANFEAERMAFMRDKSEQKLKQEELELVIQRLKDTWAQREARYSVDEDRGLPKSPNFRSRSSGDIVNEQFAPPSALSRVDSKNNSNLLVQKDKVIETLRLELTEVQIKNMEIESLRGSRMHELEKSLLETRITNARLMEDNESFQLLLSEKTLNGDFSKTELMEGRGRLGSLAEELESAEGESDNYRRLELEAKSLKDQNKALTLYIENIIGRLLQHKEFENILDKTPDLMSGAPRHTSMHFDKELPPPPPKDDDAPPSMLQRARSVVGGPRRPRPVSLIPSQASAPSISENPFKVPSTPNEDPSKAPSISLSRSQSTRGTSAHRRSQSDLASVAPLVNQMYRGPPSTGSGAMMSPGLPPSSIPSRNSYFGAANINSTSSRTPSGSRLGQERSGSSSNSTFSDNSGEIGSTAGAPRANALPNNYTGAVMTQSKLRPLRLVQENRDIEGTLQGIAAGKLDEADLAAKKKANRASWISGWMSRGKQDDSLRSVSAGSGTE